MKPPIVQCEFEADALAIALQSRWPDRIDDDLRSHISACPICSDIVTLAAAFDEAREDSRTCAQVPDAGRVWRRAQVRARCEAAEKAMAPISITQMIGLASAVGVAAACFGASSAWLQATVKAAVTSFSAEPMRALLSVAAQHSVAIGGVVALMVAVPTLVWLTASND